MNIGFVNHSTRLSPEDFERIARAVDAQVTQDFADAWNRGADDSIYCFGTDEEACNFGCNAIVGFFDDSDQPGALGYHDESPSGLEVAYVFVGAVLDAGGGILAPLEGSPPGCCVSGCASHETLELLGNPNVNRWRDNGAGAEYWEEVCDPCEAWGYAVSVLSENEAGQLIEVFVSDFVLPSYFDPKGKFPYNFVATIDPLDENDRLPSPFSVDPNGGYMGVLDISKSPFVEVTGKRAAWREVNFPHTRSQRISKKRTARLLTQSIEKQAHSSAHQIEMKDLGKVTSETAPTGAMGFKLLQR